MKVREIQPNKLHKKGLYRSSYVMYDKSNAYCTFKKDVAIKNLELTGNTRQILCHALVSQEAFSVRNKIASSLYLRTTTGSAQGLPSSGEWFTSVSKKISPPCILDIDSEAICKRFRFVDDDNDYVRSRAEHHEEILERLDEKMQTDSLHFGLKNNPDKKFIMSIGCKPPVSERMLGIITNSNLTAHDEIGPTVEKLKKCINALRTTNCLSKGDRISLGKMLIHTKLSNFVFIVTHSIKSKIEEFRKTINQCFRKCTHLPLITPSEHVEYFLYGMRFYDYVDYRILKVCDKFKKTNPQFLSNIKLVRGKYRPLRNKPLGILTQKYLSIKNLNSEQYLKNTRNSKQRTARFHKNELLNFRPSYFV